MIPLLALGIPGDVITAAIREAFMIHGLRPGPILFDQNLPMIYALFMGILLSSFYLFFVGKIAIKVFSRVATVPNRILYPIVFVHCVYGTYAVNNNLFDVLVMLVMGLVGFGMLRLDIPVAPFLIAYVLGPLLEDNFRRSLLIADGDNTIFFRNTICIMFLGSDMPVAVRAYPQPYSGSVHRQGICVDDGWVNLICKTKGCGLSLSK